MADEKGNKFGKNLMMIGQIILKRNIFYQKK